eukprot:CAMPEP_0119123694 /NCGR_PEP_ID=MMETSP1310-20130426/3560_1 /TAXON_ID=464262 /ORGANISM="Genus nov. species nov., Strain RCC2339" /LENGTH=545 /DNA_ID=CAMNT_0007113551 /DNA_START=94 /DNA_END=1731 /DNA_ORIENTATION=+
MSKRQEQQNQKKLRDLSTQGRNKRCMDCTERGPFNVCLTFGTFICSTCSGVHREFGHRVKSISMALFKPHEMEIMEKGGNDRARAIYLARWDERKYPEPKSGDVSRIREFIRQKYVDKIFYQSDAAPSSRTGSSSSRSRQSSRTPTSNAVTVNIDEVAPHTISSSPGVSWRSGADPFPSHPSSTTPSTAQPHTASSLFESSPPQGQRSPHIPRGPLQERHDALLRKKQELDELEQNLRKREEALMRKKQELDQLASSLQSEESRLRQRQQPDLQHQHPHEAIRAMAVHQQAPAGYPRPNEPHVSSGYAGGSADAFSAAFGGGPGGAPQQGSSGVYSAGTQPSPAFAAAGFQNQGSVGGSGSVGVGQQSSPAFAATGGQPQQHQQGAFGAGAQHSATFAPGGGQPYGGAGGVFGNSGVQPSPFGGSGQQQQQQQHGGGSFGHPQNRSMEGQGGYGQGRAGGAFGQTAGQPQGGALTGNNQTGAFSPQGQALGAFQSAPPQQTTTQSSAPDPFAAFALSSQKKGGMQVPPQKPANNTGGMDDLFSGF